MLGFILSAWGLLLWKPECCRLSLSQLNRVEISQWNFTSEKKAMRRNREELQILSSSVCSSTRRRYWYQQWWWWQRSQQRRPKPTSLQHFGGSPGLLVFFSSSLFPRSVSSASSFLCPFLLNRDYTCSCNQELWWQLCVAIIGLNL